MFKLDFPNIRTEADFVRAYVHAFTALRRDIKAYLSAHGFDQQKYERVFTERIGSLYVGLTDAQAKGRISMQAMEALALLWHKEMLEISHVELGYPVDNYDAVIAEYAKVQHFVTRALDEA